MGGAARSGQSGGAHSYRLSWHELRASNLLRVRHRPNTRTSGGRLALTPCSHRARASSAVAPASSAASGAVCRHTTLATACEPRSVDLKDSDGMIVADSQPPHIILWLPHATQVSAAAALRHPYSAEQPAEGRPCPAPGCDDADVDEDEDALELQR